MNESKGKQRKGKIFYIYNFKYILKSMHNIKKDTDLGKCGCGANLSVVGM